MNLLSLRRQGFFIFTFYHINQFAACLCQTCLQALSINPHNKNPVGNQNLLNQFFSHRIFLHILD